MIAQISYKHLREDIFLQFVKLLHVSLEYGVIRIVFEELSHMLNSEAGILLDNLCSFGADVFLTFSLGSPKHIGI